MAAFIDEVINIHHTNTFVLYAFIDSVALVADIHNFFRKHKRSCSCIDGSCIPRFFNSGNDAASFLELVELDYFLSSLSVRF